MPNKGGGPPLSGTSVGLILGALVIMLAVSVCYRHFTCQSARDVQKLRRVSCSASVEIIADEQHDKRRKAPRTPRLLMQIQGPQRLRHEKLVDESSLACHDDVADTHAEAVELERNNIESAAGTTNIESNIESGDAISPCCGEHKDGATEYL